MFRRSLARRALISFASAVAAVITLSSCSSPQAQPQLDSPIDRTATREQKASAARPACLNIRDGDRRIEFTGTQLILGEGKRVRKLALTTSEAPALATCIELGVVEKARVSSMTIKYMTSAQEVKVAIASIGDKKSDPKWILEPTTLEQRGTDSAPGKKIATAEWSTDSTNHAVLRLTELRTGDYSVIKP